MHWGTEIVAQRIGVGLVILTLAGCSAPNTASANHWEWQPTEDEATAPPAHYYYDYASAEELVLGQITAVVKVRELSHNVLVEATDESEEWTYTPAQFEILESGNSGLGVGEIIEVAIPGGTAEGVTPPSLWSFNKREIDSSSQYLVSWTRYDYPNFALDQVLQFIYEHRENSPDLIRLQTNPEAAPGPADVFSVNDDPIGAYGDQLDAGATNAVAALRE